MKEYHKIENIYIRDNITNKLVEGQYRMSEVEWLAHNQWIATEKVDGTNIRVMWDGTKITFGGKTNRAQFPSDLVKRLEELFLDKAALFAEKFGEKQVCLYGEGYGAGIQKGGLYKQVKDFVLFDVLIGDLWLERGNVEGIAQMLDIDVVPVVAVAPLVELVLMVKNGFESRWGHFVAEGIVCRPQVELFNRFGERIIVKIKTKDFS